MEEQKKKKNFRSLFFIRLIAGIVFLVFGILHLVKPENFENILRATHTPLVAFNMVFVPIVEAGVGLLFILGLFSRFAGIVGCIVMAVATWSTIVLMKLDPSALPSGLTQKPFAPPIIIPILLFIFSLYIFIFGAGAWSIDHRRKG